MDKNSTCHYCNRIIKRTEKGWVHWVDGKAWWTSHAATYSFMSEEVK